MSVFFYRLYQICTSQNHKNQISFSVVVIFLEYLTKIRISSNAKYFQEHGKKGYSKINRFPFRLTIGTYLKFLSSKIIDMQI